ncbi:MAG: hypothetical protein HQL44_05365 [Alphaproteobacteria bacterium]|nr:hypothetical protein [Alphaproteobacteria bacterium]
MIDSTEANKAGYAKRSLLRLALALILAMTLLYVLFANDRTDFAQAGLGADAVSVYAQQDGVKVHCASPWDDASCLPSPSAKSHVLWLGASQLHVIMRAKLGERTAPDLLAEALSVHGVEVKTYSVGNANLQEMRIMLEGAIAGAKPNYLVLGLVYDDLKEEDIHPQVAEILGNASAVAKLRATHSGRSLLEQVTALKSRFESANAATSQAQTSDRTASAKPRIVTLQEGVEAALTGWLSNHSELWRLRDAARGHLRIVLTKAHDEILLLRYTLLGKKPPSSHVPIPEAIRQRNWMAFLDLLERSREAGIHPFVYIAPKPKGAFFPYSQGDYAAFKQQAALAVGKMGGDFVDLEDALDDDGVWGTIFDGKGRTAMDIFHFDGKGHQDFFRVIEAHLERIMTP